MRFRLTSRPGNGPESLVLFHAIGGSLDSWNVLVPLLLENLTYCAEMRGAGISEKVCGTLNIGSVCDEMVAQGACCDRLSGSGARGKIRSVKSSAT
jgi:3-oxoadipate enol-lactonase